MRTQARDASLGDAPEIARLSGMFGYVPDAAAHRDRLALLLTRTDPRIWVGDWQGALSGWLHARTQLSLPDDGYLEIAGLVVDESRRSRGIGTALLHTAEHRARADGHREIRVSSNLIREPAHASMRASTISGANVSRCSPRPCDASG